MIRISSDRDFPVSLLPLSKIGIVGLEINDQKSSSVHVAQQRQLKNRLFHVVERARMATKCTQMKKRPCKSCKTTVSCYIWDVLVAAVSPLLERTRRWRRGPVVKALGLHAF